LDGIDAWIMVLDTKGINVWCAAGKGTFGTEEIIHRLQAVRLEHVVTHRRLLVPQLGAPGVSAHNVKHRSGFQVVYGPVRAENIPAFLDAGMTAESEMRRVKFSIRDRAVLVPVDFVGGLKYALLIAAGFFILSGLYSWGYSLDLARMVGSWSMLMFAGAYVAGTTITPVLLPWIPGRAFSTKGAWIGLIVSVILVRLMQGNLGAVVGWLDVVSWVLMGTTVSSFIAMNFTGSSTFTSLSGVRKEMKTAVPLQIIGAGVGLMLWLVARFV
jgi:acetyl-CoA decarbonylase/synthase complex subunit gamma